MSPNLDPAGGLWLGVFLQQVGPPQEAQVERTLMSRKELERGEALSRVKGGELKLANAAELIRVSYRQVKRLWKRYREEGAKGLLHRQAGRPSNRTKPKKFRDKVLRLVREKYSGEEGQRFGPTL